MKLRFVGTYPLRLNDRLLKTGEIVDVEEGLGLANHAAFQPVLDEPPGEKPKPKKKKATGKGDS